VWLFHAQAETLATAVLPLDSGMYHDILCDMKLTTTVDPMKLTAALAVNMDTDFVVTLASRPVPRLWPLPNHQALPLPDLMKALLQAIQLQLQMEVHQLTLPPPILQPTLPPILCKTLQPQMQLHQAARPL
jgi:hypothetical protein